VEANTVEAAAGQKLNHCSNEPFKLKVSLEVLLDNPTRRKLDPFWTGLFTVKEVKGPLNVRIEMNNKE